MARCNCAGSSCSCQIVAGRGVTVVGVGTTDRPMVISAEPASISVQDSASIDLTLTGDGVTGNPYVISAEYVGSLDPIWRPSTVEADWQDDVDLSDESLPCTIRATLIGDVTSLSLPLWDSDKAGIIHLVLAQDGVGGHTWDHGYTTPGGAPIVLSTAPAARDYVACHWTGGQWILLLIGSDVMAVTTSP